MTSLASLARAAAAPPSAFNGLFYATVATIIPVLFLAIAVQGQFLEELLALYIASTRRVRSRGCAIQRSGRSPLSVRPAHR